MEQPTLPRVLVGLYGGTGTGKSSIINALIDKILLHSNAMRAGTAVVTELAWNHCDEKKRAFRAEVEFISEDEWKAELDILCSDILDKPDDIGANSSSPASVAFARVLAVYPQLNMGGITAMSSERLLADKSLANILGKSHYFEDSALHRFKRNVSKYTNSSNRAASGVGEDTIAYWPLVRRVKLYIKAEVLKTGIVLVDLPGSSDDNAARNAIAANYMKNLDAIWVVADIVRAVDDKIATELLGRSFKRQLKMDGNYDSNHISFIMTKSDNLTTDETISELSLQEELKVAIMQEKATTVEIQQSMSKLRKLERAFKSNRRALEKLNKELKNRGLETEELEQYRTRGLKRKHDDFIMEDELSQDHYDMQSSARPFLVPTTRKRDEFHQQADVEGSQESSVLITRKAELEESMKLLEGDKDEVSLKISKLEQKLKVVKADLKGFCIQKRNEWSTSRIRHDFEQGIKDFAIDLAEEADDYDETPASSVSAAVSHRPPPAVFCVSSKAFQKMRGRYKKEPPVEGFLNAESTGIPALRQHCLNSTLYKRQQMCNRTMNALDVLVERMRFWAEDNTPDYQISASQKTDLEKVIAREFEILRKVCGLL